MSKLLLWSTSKTPKELCQAETKARSALTLVGLASPLGVLWSFATLRMFRGGASPTPSQYSPFMWPPSFAMFTAVGLLVGFVSQGST